MTIEEQVLAALRAMDDEAKEYTLEVAKGQARLWPAPARKPALSLVPLNPTHRFLLGGPSRLHDVHLTPVSRAPKQVK
jgi:hypothetical protein